MVTYGSLHPKKNDNNVHEEALRTVRALSRTVPPALAGVTVHTYFILVPFRRSNRRASFSTFESDE